MSEKIYIENFAGLNNVEIELKNINIIIGPQTSGKSIIVKLIYFFKGFLAELAKGIEKDESLENIDKGQINKFIKYFPIEAWPKQPFLIRYSFGNEWIQIEKETNNQDIQFKHSSKIENVFYEGRLLLSNFDSEQENGYLFQAHMDFKQNFWNLAHTQFGSSLTSTQFFIPAGRSFFANLQSSIFSILSNDNSLDPFLVEFGTYYESFKRLYFNERSAENQSDLEFDKLIKQIMNGSVIRKNNEDFIAYSDHRMVNLTHASSGQQEILPLAVVLKNLRVTQGQSARATSIYIEEPEAHLFPTAQRIIVQLLARTYNSPTNNFQIFVTTHSPYILSVFNNLIEAGKLMKERPTSANEITKIIPEEEILKPDDIAAFSISDGEVIPLIDPETRLISENFLDSVSDQVADEFGKLLNIEFE